MAVKENSPPGKTKKVKNGQKSTAKPVESKKLKIKLIRSLIGRPRKQHEVVKGLGLRRINSEVIRKDCPEVWGMIRKVPHLVIVEELDTK
jgi:large subunit ribosomal protein L30